MICIPKDLWLRDFTLAGEWEGRWTVSSPPDNDGSTKRIFRTFHASRKVASHANALLSFIERKREETSQIVSERFSDRYGILKRLLLNESGPNDFSSFFRLLGFVHLYSASGIHLYAVSAWIGWMISIVSEKLLIPLAIALPLARLFSVSLWIWGWALTGCKLSLLRPLLLIGIRRLASTLGFRWRVWTPLLLSLFLDLIFSSLISKSDWLQGAAFYALAIAGGALADGHVLVCLSSWIFLAIWEALKTAQIALFTPVLSLATLTVTTTLVYPILMISSLVGSLPFFPFPSRCFDAFIAVLLKLSFSAGNLWIVKPVAVIIAIFWVMLSSIFKKSFRYFLLALSIIGMASLRFFPSTPKIIQLDVGQGDGALYAGETTGLIDSGSKHALSDVGWMELFAREGITQVSWIGLTHLDEDHSGGALRIARLIPIGCVATSDNELSTPRGTVYEAQLKSMQVEVDHSLGACVPFPSYEPAKQPPSVHAANENMSAFIIPLKNGGFWLSAGDATEKDEVKIGQWAETQIAQMNGDERILKVSHHGSKTSSNPDYIRMIRPTEAWISDGVGNRYGHPASSVLEEFKNFGIPVKRTDETGAIREAAVHRPR